jgi:uncharacterized protein (TIGR00299 family) protein
MWGDKRALPLTTKERYSKGFWHMTRMAYLDCQTGISCEALLGALLDASLSLEVLQQQLALLPLPVYNLTLAHAWSSKTRGTSVSLVALEQQVYDWAEIETLLSAPQVPSYIRETTMAILQRLVEAEAKVSDEETPYASFAIQATTLTLLIACIVGLHELNIAQVYVSALPLAVQTQARKTQAPFPATLELLRHIGAVWKPGISEGESVTPLAAALLATLAHFDAPLFTIEQVGYGVNAATSANFLRLYLGKAQNVGVQNVGEADTDWVTVLSTNIDNMSGELLGGLMERLFDAGAFDVSYTPLQMKKNRPATMLMVICPLEKGNELAYILLRETTTLGVRIGQVQRLKAQRTSQRIDTPLGPMLVKVKRLGARIVSATPEYEECQRIARKQNIPLADVYAVAQQWIAKTIIDRKEK